MKAGRLFLFGIVTNLALAANSDPAPNISTSPSGRYAIFNLGDSAKAECHFEIRQNHGKVLFRSNDDPPRSFGVSQDSLDTWAENILWSPDERWVAFSIHTGKPRETCVFSLASNQIIWLAGPVDGSVTPVRWVNTRMFVVENRTPTYGHYDSQWHYRETYRVAPRRFELTRVFKGAELEQSWK